MHATNPQPARQPTNHFSPANSVVRDAMVNVMFATIPQCGALLPTPPPPIEGAEDNGVVDKNCQVEGRWSKTVLATDATLPRTTSTCLLWCAIALGALVRGCPLTHVGCLRP